MMENDLKLKEIIKNDQKNFSQKETFSNDNPIKKNFQKGVNFLTPNHLTLQLGFIKHKANTYIKPHTHKNYLRRIKKTTEILFIKNGSIRVIFIQKKKIV